MARERWVRLVGFTFTEPTANRQDPYRLIAEQVWNAMTHAEVGDNGVDTIAEAIRNHTVVPELTAERDRLKKRNEQSSEFIFEAGKIEAETLTKLIRLEAEKAGLGEALDKIANFAGEDDVVTINTIVGIAQAALAKHEEKE